MLTRFTRHALPLAFVSAIMLALPSLNAPLLQDDVAHRALLLDKLPGLHWGPLELYDFIGGPSRPVSRLRDSGFAPWFAADDLKLRFFRPLSSAVLAADAHLFGEHLWASRLHSLVWFLGILAGVAALHRRFLPPASAGLATLIYAVSVGHLMPVGWIAARPALISTALALVSVWLHLRVREEGWTPARWLSPMAYAAGLFAGEMALGAVALIGAWELFARRDPIRRRIVALLPLAALTIAYLAFYVAMDYGVRGSGAYIGAGGGPAGAVTLFRHGLILAAELIAATPSDGVGAGTLSAQTVSAVWGAVMTVVAWTLFRLSRTHVDARESDAMRWMPVAAAAAALPGAFALVGGRVLTLALVPSSAVVAILIVAGVAAVRGGALRPLGRAFAGVTVAGLILGHLVAAPAFRVFLARVLTDVAVKQHTLAAQVPACAGVMVLVAASDPVIATYVPATMILRDRGPERLRVLSMAPSDHRIENVTRTGFDLVTRDTDRTRTIWERLYRSGPLPAGTRVTIPSLDAVVVEDRLGAPARVRFDFGEPLDSAHLCFYEWRDGAVTPLAPPKRGDTIELAHHPGPMGW